ncbi:MAG: GNAT family N-acetyltransferase [Actinobacteria bacterium]|nr:GNAT family N-acetyltransferase [Actinomycetota bacterium]
MDLVRPTAQHLASYLSALQRISTKDDPFFKMYERELAEIAQDSASFLASMDDLEAKRPPIELPNGSIIPRLPSITRWMWDGDVCGSTQLRWLPGTTDLPPYCLGHISYAVFPWKRQRGYASTALALLLPSARDLGMDFVEVVADVENLTSQKVILRNGGSLVEEFTKPVLSGGGQAFRYRILLETA